MSFITHFAHEQHANCGHKIERMEVEKMTIEQEMELWELLFDYTEELEELDRTQMIGCDGGLLVEAYENTAFELGEAGYSKETIDGYAGIYAVNLACAFATGDGSVAEASGRLNKLNKWR